MHHGKITKPIADGLIELRQRIEQGGIPSSKLDETLNLATWNIRSAMQETRMPRRPKWKPCFATLVRPVI